MSIPQRPKTAKELGLMSGFPPPREKIVNHDQQLLAPYNRWSFQNELGLNRTVDVWRGPGVIADLVSSALDLSQVIFQDWTGRQISFEEMVESSYTDGIVVLYEGRVIYERYLNGMQEHTLHAWASCSKSMTGVLASMLAHQGLFDRDAPVSTYLPEMKDSGFGDATVRQVMDMTTAVAFPENDRGQAVESVQYGIALGWLAKPDGYAGPTTCYEFLPTMRKRGEHGVRFTYLTPNTDLLAWLMKRLLNKTLAEIMYELIWSKLGPERDAFWIVDSAAAETAGSGLITTVRDMARFGQMLLQMGYFNGRRIVPEAAVEDIQGGGDAEAFARGPAAAAINRGWSYHNQWWVTHNTHGVYIGLGYGGQILYVNPTVQLVVAKMSSYPTPTPAGNEFYGAMAALPALAKFLAEQ